MTNLPADARVWVYQADQPFNPADREEIQAALQRFAREWVSHNRQLHADGALLHDRFVVLVVDETQADASGCSIDSSVAFLKSLGARYHRDLFDRMRFSYEQDGQVYTVSRDKFEHLYAEGLINDETIVFDPLVKTRGELETSFRKPLGESWHQRFV
ncbi:MAG: hypothetical protein KDC54_08425 [Lewinella sp.]|nr:hypothetical protein [Lewinella sp.]